LTVVLLLSWPARELWQNSRAHFMAKARATKTARREALILSQQAALHRLQNVVSANLEFEFHPPLRSRATDIQNMPATQKAAIDGIAEALGLDDKVFEQPVWPATFAAKSNPGHVLVRVTPIYETRGIK
jgi:crossover junction endodeoxyribonuclease RusA